MAGRGGQVRAGKGLSSAGVLFARPRWDRDGPPSWGRSLRRPRRCSTRRRCHPRAAAPCATCL